MRESRLAGRNSAITMANTPRPSDTTPAQDARSGCPGVADGVGGVAEGVGAGVEVAVVGTAPVGAPAGERSMLFMGDATHAAPGAIRPIVG
ncbi:hypothetical protein [Herbiconiux sp. UC225_62]|uniref:hypothetical protein n=1 Tax=Herbiconiux sp. UC225_62 TaxID=3350168 RepID=UPI0036D2333C